MSNNVSTIGMNKIVTGALSINALINDVTIRMINETVKMLRSEFSVSIFCKYNIDPFISINPANTNKHMKKNINFASILFK